MSLFVRAKARGPAARGRRSLVFGTAFALVLLGAAAGALADTTTGSSPAIAISNVSCAASGYQFTVSGTGFPASTTVYVFIGDNVYSGVAQFMPEGTDATGAFTFVDAAAGTGQQVPATVAVGDKTYLRNGGASGTLYPVSATVIPPDCSLVVATLPTTTPGSSSTIRLQTVDSATGLPTSGTGRGVRFSTTLGTFPGACTVNCLATDNADGTYTLALTSPTAGTATVTATINDPTYGTVPVKNSATVTFAAPPPAPDLSVTKTTSSTSVTAGSTIGYAITVANHGNTDAPGVTLADTVTGGTISSLTTAAPNACTAAAGTCGLGTIAAGTSVSVTEVVATTAAGTVTNSATAATTGAETNLTDNTGTAPPVTVTAPPPPPPPPSGSCNTPGEVLSGTHWSMQTSSVVNRKTVVQKHDVYVGIEADCDYDSKTHATYLHHAFVLVYVDGSPLIQAATESFLGKVDIQNVTLNGPDATLTGTYKGTSFTVTLHDGGRVRNGNDTVRAQYGSFDTATLSAAHCTLVHIQD